MLGSVILAVVLVIGLGVLAMMMPEIRLSRASALVASGDLDAAENFINVLESEGAPESRIDLLRLGLAERHLAAGHFDTAMAMAAELPESNRQREVISASRYGLAEASYDAGRYEEAAMTFYQLSGYRDSDQRFVDCRCALIVLAYLSGDTEIAEKKLLAMNGAPDRIEGVVRQLADGEQAENMLAMDIFNGPALARLQEDHARLSAARANLASGRVACGYRHSVGVRPDGTAVAAGNNSYGQCNVSGWTDVIQVAAGAMHTIGLRADGTVVATGSNSYGQCEVSGWTDVVCVAANAYGSFALRRDGTVLASSQYAGKVAGWHGATLVAAGSYSAGCLYAPDGMLCTHPGGQLSSADGLTSLGVCGPVSAGIDEEGRLVTNYPDPPRWEDLVSVAVCENGLVGVTRDGKAASFLFRGRREVPLEIEGSAVEAAAGGTHILIVNEAGHVFAFGKNDQGQCDVTDWRL